LPLLSPAESGAFVGYLQANPMPPHPKAHHDCLIGIVPVSMYHRVVQAFPSQQLHREDGAAKIIGLKQGANLQAQ
jgi:hypothetical protein